MSSTWANRKQVRHRDPARQPATTYYFPNSLLPATTSTYYPLQAEETAENLVRGNELLDSAAKHSRDFRLLVLA